MKIFLVSKKNTWSDKLYHLIKDNIIVGAYGHFDCLYFNDDSYKKEVSKNYTVSIAYNKGAYQVIPRSEVKNIGK